MTMNPKRILPIMRCLALVVFLVSACAPQASAPAQPAAQAPVATEASAAATEAPAAAAPVAAGAEVTATGDVSPTVAIAGQQPFPDGTELKILQWSHFVPRYDQWFDKFAADWGAANNVKVTVDHIDQAKLIPTLTAAIDAGEGPPLAETIIAPSLFVEGVRDLTDVNTKAQELFGAQTETCKANSYLPATKMWYGFCHGWSPDPGDYDINLWTKAGFPNGPATYDDLLKGGAQINKDDGVPVGLGLSPEIDSNMAMRAIIWSFGGSDQDANECVTINSPQVINAVKYVADLYKQTMTDEVFSWNAASNNQGLIAGELNYILNSISAYRSLQKVDAEAAKNIGFTEALKGPNGDQHASAHLWFTYIVPKYVKDGPNFDAAKAFMLALVANYNQATYNSELYNFPAFKSTVPQLYKEGGWLDKDPFGSEPPNKLKVLATADNWVTYMGWPGTANPATSEVFATNIIPTMMGKVALGQMSAEDAVKEAETQMNAIYDKWRAKGLVGCKK
jgi:multiple sugar transport system substrate-binding protein